MVMQPNATHWLLFDVHNITDVSYIQLIFDIRWNLLKLQLYCNGIYTMPLKSLVSDWLKTSAILRERIFM